MIAILKLNATITPTTQLVENAKMYVAELTPTQIQKKVQKYVSKISLPQTYKCTIIKNNMYIQVPYMTLYMYMYMQNMN